MATSINASTLIEMLQAMIAKHGDREIYVHDCDTDWALGIRARTLDTDDLATEHMSDWSGVYFEPDPKLDGSAPGRFMLKSKRYHHD